MSDVRSRRAPDAFRHVAVTRVVACSPFLVRVTLHGAELDGLDAPEPASSVRLLLADRAGGDVTMPEWRGNEFLLPDGGRPVIRTLTPVRFDPVALELDVEVVLHGGGPLSEWASSARIGGRAAVSGFGRGYVVGAGAASLLVAGDESALPAIATVLTSVAPDVVVRVLVEVRDARARIELTGHAHADVTWILASPGSAPGDALVEAVAAESVTAGSRVWAAGEAAAVQRIRRHLFDERMLDRSAVVARGYWKHGR